MESIRARQGCLKSKEDKKTGMVRNHENALLIKESQSNDRAGDSLSFNARGAFFHWFLVIPCTAP